MLPGGGVTTGRGPGRRPGSRLAPRATTGRRRLRLKTASIPTEAGRRLSLSHRLCGAPLRRRDHLPGAARETSHKRTTTPFGTRTLDG